MPSGCDVQLIMRELERIMARTYLGTQMEIIGGWLDEDPDLPDEKRANWQRLHDTLSQVNLCFYDMERDITRKMNSNSEYKLRVLEDAERIGSMKNQVASLEEENARLKETVSKAIQILSENHLNPAPLWLT